MVEEASDRLVPGDRAPDFTLPDTEGRPVSLADFRGRDTIVYFYPEALTPACTEQACDFRDSLGELAAAGYQVVGISRDSPAKLAEFARLQHLDFPLLSDPDLVVHQKYRVWGEKNSYGRLITGVIRSTFVVDATGRIAHTFYNTKAKGHVAMLKKRLGLTA